MSKVKRFREIQRVREGFMKIKKVIFSFAVLMWVAGISFIPQNTWGQSASSFMPVASADLEYITPSQPIMSFMTQGKFFLNMANFSFRNNGPNTASNVIVKFTFWNITGVPVRYGPSDLRIFIDDMRCLPEQIDNNPWYYICHVGNISENQGFGETLELLESASVYTQKTSIGYKVEVSSDTLDFNLLNNSGEGSINFVPYCGDGLVDTPDEQCDTNLFHTTACPNGESCINCQCKTTTIISPSLQETKSPAPQPSHIRKGLQN